MVRIAFGMPTSGIIRGPRLKSQLNCNFCFLFMCTEIEVMALGLGSLSPKRCIKSQHLAAASPSCGGYLESKSERQCLSCIHLSLCLAAREQASKNNGVRRVCPGGPDAAIREICAPSQTKARSGLSTTALKHFADMPPIPLAFPDFYFLQVKLKDSTGFLSTNRLRPAHFYP